MLCHDSTSRSLEDLGIKYNLAECEVKPAKFYSISCVTPFTDGEFDGTHIFCGNTIFVSPLPYERVIETIESI